jgi:opacity protein-like surface antigen
LFFKGVFMKKLMVTAALFVLIGTAAFTQLKVPEFELSAGAGLLLTGGLGGGVEGTLYGYGGDITTTYTGFGGYAFLDGTFAELGVGILGGKIKAEMDVPGIVQVDDKLSFSALDISLLGKWPFTFGKISVFPLLGFEYRAFLYIEDYENPKTGKKNQSDFNQFWFNLGAGLDFALTDSLYLRGELLYGIRTKTKYEKDGEKLLKSGGVNTDIPLGHGPTVRIAVGYKF